MQMDTGSHSLSSGRKRRPNFNFASARRRRNGAHAPRGGGKKATKKRLIACVVAIIIVIGGFALILTNCSNCGGNVDRGASIEVTIKEGSSASGIGDLLVEKHVIGNANAFKNAVVSRDCASKLKPGTYTFIGGQNIDSIIDDIIDGSKGKGVLIPEGCAIKDIAKRVANVSKISENEFIAETKKAAEYEGQFSFLQGAYNGSMEGYLFPDTYAIDSETTASNLVTRMLKNYDQHFKQVDMSYAKSKNLTQSDVTTLASIIEKESRTKDDMAQVAEVFYNRLRQHIPLQSDVTTYYAVGKDMTQELTKEDLASTSPYNTRNTNNYGLPPGPICSPGLAALQAAANPTTGNNLFFFYSASRNEVMFFEDQASFEAAWAKYGS